MEGDLKELPVPGGEVVTDQEKYDFIEGNLEGILFCVLGDKKSFATASSWDGILFCWGAWGAMGERRNLEHSQRI